MNWGNLFSHKRSYESAINVYLFSYDAPSTPQHKTASFILPIFGQFFINAIYWEKKKKKDDTNAGLHMSRRVKDKGVAPLQIAGYS